MLSPLGDERTRFETTEHGYTTAEARDMSRAGLDKMAALVAS